MIVDDGNAERFPFAPAANSSAASPHALPTHSVKIGGFTYLQSFITWNYQKELNSTKTSVRWPLSSGTEIFASLSNFQHSIGIYQNLGVNVINN